MTGGLVVVGGGPAGHSAAAAYRSRRPKERVRILSADRHPPYNRPPLSKDFLRGESELADLPLEPSSFYAERDIEVVLSDPVTGLDPSRRRVSTSSGGEIPYDACILATGSAPMSLPVDGGDDAAVLRLRSRDHAGELRSRAEQARSAVVIGSGFIGCEAAMSLAMRGLPVVLVTQEPSPQAGRLGSYAATRISDWLRDAGITLVTDAEVSAIEHAQTVRLGDGSRLSADLVLTAVGIEPQSQLAAVAGLAVDQGRVQVDEHMASDAPGLYAAGDVALAFNTGAGRRLVVEHWGEAMTMGEIAGASAAGDDVSWSTAPGFWSEIGEHTIKYAAWGDGFDEARPVHHDDGSFTVWYGTQGVCVGVLTHLADDDYERGLSLVQDHATLPQV